ncbi:CHRD domain-containing protein [Spirosoma luteum]|uniref:CHRD domain-containing protein n=1 Tax=Spirosoma luteum TaxID=431553 RepID=UPI00037BEDEE|nr:CHRD domain-containing protein [Spirosoma luteum]
MKKTSLLSVAALLVLGFLSLSFKHAPKAMVSLTATLNGASEKTTPTPSTATGTFDGTLNTTTRVLSYTVTYQGFTPTMGDLHKITKADGTGGVDVGFKSVTSPIMGTTTALPQSKIDSMLNGFYYVNLHSAAYPAGEIRGNIKKK